MTQVSALPVNSVAPADWWRRVSTTVNAIVGLTADLYRRPTAAVTGDYAVSQTDYLVTIDATGGNVSVTLPAVTKGRQIVFKRLDGSSNTVTLSGQVDGATSLTLTSQWQAYTLIGGADRWLIV